MVNMVVISVMMMMMIAKMDIWRGALSPTLTSSSSTHSSSVFIKSRKLFLALEKVSKSSANKGNTFQPLSPHQLFAYLENENMFHMKTSKCLPSSDRNWKPFDHNYCTAIVIKQQSRFFIVAELGSPLWKSSSLFFAHWPCALCSVQASDLLHKRECAKSVIAQNWFV